MQEELVEVMLANQPFQIHFPINGRLDEKLVNSLVDTQNTPSDDVVYSRKYLFYPTNRCNTCGVVAKLKRCGGCGLNRYCSMDCQVSDWSVHRTLCKQLKKNGSRWQVVKEPRELKYYNPCHHIVDTEKTKCDECDLNPNKLTMVTFT